MGLFFIGFIVGIIIASIGTVFTLALCYAAKRGDQMMGIDE